MDRCELPRGRTGNMKTAMLVVGLIGCLGSLAAPGVDYEIVRKGIPCAEVVLAEDAVKAARFGAAELVAHVKAMTGAELSVVTPATRDKGKTSICIGVSSLTESQGFRAESFGAQEYVLACRKGMIVLVGLDKADRGEFKLQFGGDVNDIVTQGHPNDFKWPTFYDERGSLHAVYDFLRDFCGVDWLDPTDAGTIVPKRRTLFVTAFKDRRVRPFIRSRADNLSDGLVPGSYQPELWKEKTEGWSNFLWTAYGRAKTRRFPPMEVLKQKRLFLLRKKVGGERITSNHSLYSYYERFLDKDRNPKNFESFHPEYFAKRSATEDLKLSPDDPGQFARIWGKEKYPRQLCYSNPAVVSQVVADLRAYFDEGGYRVDYCGSRKGPYWGVNNCALSPMDGGGFCQCPSCTKEYEPARAKDFGDHSTYWFGFVNKVAREIKRSHPGKVISTGAYCSYEGLPTGLKVEDNVVIHYTIHGNRMPNSPLLAEQERRVREWRATYPKNDFGIWLYNNFPSLIAFQRGFHCFPGFFSKQFAEQFQFLKELDLRAALFFDGMRDDFENYLAFAWMWNPDIPLKVLKNRYFASYGAAEKPIRAFYDTIEDRFCTKANWRGWTSHENRTVAWKYLGDDETMARLGALMRQAETAKGLTPQARARVANWKAGYWDYMYNGKYQRFLLPSDMPGVTVRKVLHLFVPVPEPFGKSVLAGAVTEVIQDDPHGYIVSHETDYKLMKRKVTDVLTDGVYTNVFFAEPKVGEVRYVCRKPIRDLKKARVTLARPGEDPSRTLFRFRLVGLVGGKEVPLSPWAEQSEWLKRDPACEPGKDIFMTYDFDFAPGSVPKNIEALMIVDATKRDHPGPRYLELEAR